MYSNTDLYRPDDMRARPFPFQCRAALTESAVVGVNNGLDALQIRSRLKVEALVELVADEIVVAVILIRHFLHLSQGWNKEAHHSHQGIGGDLNLGFDPEFSRDGCNPLIPCHRLRRGCGPVVNSGKSQAYPTTTRDGTLYFQALRNDGYGKADIYRSRLVDGEYLTPENLGPIVNSANYEGDVFIAHDESYMVVSVYGREDGLGEGDLYVSFQNPDSSWSPLKNMGAGVNSVKRDFCPMVTPDGRYLFFSSKRLGVGDIFWVDADVIEALRDD